MESNQYEIPNLHFKKKNLKRVQIIKPVIVDQNYW